MTSTSGESLNITFEPHGHTYWHGERELLAVSTILKEAGVAPLSMNAAAAQKGTLVHQACEYFDEGDLDLHALDARLRGYVDAYARFKQEHAVVVRASEQIVAHLELGMAGRLDRLADVDGFASIVDLKSGHAYAWHAQQTWGYRLCYGQDVERLAVYLREDGSYTLSHYTDDAEDDAVFRAALTIAQWKHRVSHREPTALHVGER